MAQLTGAVVNMPVSAYVGIHNNRLVGSGGLAWGNGRCWLFLNVFEDAPNAIVVWRWAKRMLVKAAQLGEAEVYTPRDEQYETSERLLTRLGFSLFSIENGVEVWRYECPALNS